MKLKLYIIKKPLELSRGFAIQQIQKNTGFCVVNNNYYKDNLYMQILSDYES